MFQISILDTGTSNIKSVVNAVKHLNFLPVIIKEEKEINNAELIILPGVGSFDKVMQSIKSKNLLHPLRDVVLKKHIPILGICIGMQILFEKSDEGNENGLGLMCGNIKKLDYNVKSIHKVPNTGFKRVFFNSSNFLVPKNTTEAPLYFNHSYGLLSEDFLFSHDVCKHNSEFVASFNHNNIFGMQFHPEKSQQIGLYMLKQFIKIGLIKSK